MAWLGNPNVRASSEDVPSFLRTIHATIVELAGDPTQATTDADTAAAPDESVTPAVSVRKSLASRDHILSLIDGKPYKTLRRHLSTHGLTPEQYREPYNLKADYPMVAPAFSEHRRTIAEKIGLGRKGKPVDEAASSTAADTNGEPTKLAAVRKSRKADNTAPDTSKRRGRSKAPTGA